MRALLACFLFFVLGMPLAGCGDAPSAASMKRYALRNAPEPEENEKTVQQASSAEAQAAADALPPAAPPPPISSKPPASEIEAKAAAVVQPVAVVEGAPATIVKKATPMPIHNRPPEQPLSTGERRSRSLANIEAIGTAISAYTKKHKRLPPPAINNEEGEKMLSWRVAILPELGYADLKAQFRPHEPWDSPHNRRLLAQIPPEYQSPERFDTRTNYLGVSNIGMAMGVPGGLPLVNIKDGADNTIAVMEVDEKYAQEWTRPVDFAISLEEPGDGVGTLRGDGTFALLASGRAVLLPRDLLPDQWASFYTPARGEPVVAADLLLPPALDQSQAEPTSAIANVASPAARVAPSSATASTIVGHSSQAAASPPSDPGRTPVPDDESLAKARELLKELYANDYAAARTLPGRQQFIKRLLADAKQVESSPADYYELLRIIRDTAAASGDLQSVIAASDLLEEKFQLDGLPLRLKSLMEVAKVSRDASGVVQEARRLMRCAQEADRYDLALQAAELAMAGARMQADRAEQNRWLQQRQSLELAQAVYAKVPAAQAALAANPNDAAASEQLGKYLCCVKNQWEQGLPLLARAADIKLRVIASIDLAANRSPAETLSLGDQYWELATTAKVPSKRGLHLRAVHCYATAATGLTGSLEKIKAQKRIDEAANLYGRDEVQQVIAPIRQQSPGTSES